MPAASEGGIYPCKGYPILVRQGDARPEQIRECIPGQGVQTVERDSAPHTAEVGDALPAALPDRVQAHESRGHGQLGGHDASAVTRPVSGSYSVKSRPFHSKRIACTPLPSCGFRYNW